MARRTMGPGAERNLVRVDRDSREQARGHRPRVTLAAAATFFVCFATIYAAPARAQSRSEQVRPSATAGHFSESLISPQYQAKTPSIANHQHYESRRSRAAWFGKPSYVRGTAPAAHSGLPRTTFAERRLPTWYQAAHSQYQLSDLISRRDSASTPPSAPPIVTKLWSGGRYIPVQTGSLIDGQIGPATLRSIVIPATQNLAQPGAQPANQTTLLALGLALGLAYVAFLVAWFWKTRGRPHGAGRVVRF